MIEYTNKRKLNSTFVTEGDHTPEIIRHSWTGTCQYKRVGYEIPFLQYRVENWSADVKSSPVKENEELFFLIDGYRTG